MAIFFKIVLQSNFQKFISPLTKKIFRFQAMDGFVEVLTALQNPDNNIRNQAEKSYESTNLGTKVDYLTQILCSDCPDEIVLIACIYLRKLLSNSDLISGFKENPSQFNEFKRKIIEIVKRHAFKQNLQQKLASLLCDTFMLESNDWKESEELLLELNSQQATLPVALYWNCFSITESYEPLFKN